MGVQSSSLSPELELRTTITSAADRHLATTLPTFLLPVFIRRAATFPIWATRQIFRHPLVYMSEPGFWDMTDTEAQNCASTCSRAALMSLRTKARDNSVEHHGRSDAARVPEHRGSRSMSPSDLPLVFDLKKIDYHHPMYPGMVPSYKRSSNGTIRTVAMIAMANTTQRSR